MHATQVYRNYSTGLSLHNIIHYSTTALLARFHLLSYSIPFPTSSLFFSPIRMKKDPSYHISFHFKYWSNQIIWMTHALLLKEEPQNNNFCPIIGLSHNYSNAKLRQVLILCQFCSLSFYISSEIKTEEAQFQINWSTITYILIIIVIFKVPCYCNACSGRKCKLRNSVSREKYIMISGM